MTDSNYSDRMIEQILRELNYCDIFNLRKLNRQFKRLIDSKLNLNSLVIFNRQFPLTCWYFNYDDNIDFKHSLKVINLNRFFSSMVARYFFSKIQNLYIYNHPKTETEIHLNVSILNYFDRIKQLEIVWIKIINDATLNMPELCLLSIEKEANPTDKLTINAEKLISFRCTTALKEFKFVYKTLKHIICQEVDNSIMEFKELITLSCFAIDSNLPTHCIERFKNFVEISFMCPFDTYKKLVADNENLMATRKCVIYFLGVTSYWSSKLDEIFKSNDGKTILDENTVKLFLRSDIRISDQIHFITKVIYCPSVERFLIIDSIVKCFFNIKTFIVNSEITNSDGLIVILKKLRRLCDLNIQNSNLDQYSFFAQIHEIVPSLNYLTIKEEKKQLNFNFISKIKNLVYIETDQKVQLNTVQNVFRINRYLDYLLFVYKSGHKVKIERTKSKFHLTLFVNTGLIRLKFDNIGDLVTHLMYFFLDNSELKVII